MEQLETRTVPSTFVVNTTADTVDAAPGDGFARDSNGNTSLRAAIMEANALAGADTIVLPAGTYALTLAGANEDAARTGDLDVTDALTIVGAGRDTTIIDARSLDRVFHVIGTSLSLSNVTVTGGRAPDATSDPANSGGGILNQMGTLTLNNVALKNNRTGNGGTYGGRGGAVYTYVGTTTITNCLITGNSTGNGSQVGGMGGGIAALQSTVTVQNSVISNNRTGDGQTGSGLIDAGRGGGAESESGNNPKTGSLTITGTTISGNVTGSSTSGLGGGIDVQDNLDLEGSVVSGNTAYQGGGIEVDNGTVQKLLNSAITANTTQVGGGGGIANSVGVITLISGTTISGNQALATSGTYSGGGGIFNQGQIGTIVNSTFSGNYTNGDGGGIDNENNISAIVNTTITDNRAADGGGLFHATFNNFTPVLGELTNTILADNAGGGAVDFRELGQVNTARNNLVESPTGNALVNGSNGNVVGFAPDLGPLADNGGPTQTQALLAGSPALNAGVLAPDVPPTDQRGLPRPSGNGPDIGAFESQVTTGWSSFGGNAQHTAVSSASALPLNAIRWQQVVDQAPYYSGGDILAHYAAPLVTSANTVIIAVKTSGGSWQLQARNGWTGAAMWTIGTDWVEPPHDWVLPLNPVLTPSNRLFFAGAGGTVWYVDNVDSLTPSAPVRVAYYGSSSYQANPSVYNANVFINTPLTSDASGNIYFGVQVTGATPLGLPGGIARVSFDPTTGAPVGTWVAASTIANDSSMTKSVDNAAPAMSMDGKTLYVAVNNGNGTSISNTGYLAALNSTTLQPTARVHLTDPTTGNLAYLPDDGTASPLVGPDGDVYFGTLENPFPHNDDRGFLLHFTGDLSTEKTPGDFGWDDTPSIVPLSMVPGYTPQSGSGTTYLLFSKYNNYADDGGDGQNRIAILDPNVAATAVNGVAGMMKEVETILGPTPNPDLPGVREWCINSAVVDGATDSVYAGSEDGKLYCWNLGSNTFTQVITLTPGIGEAYTPTAIGPDGTVYAINNATLFAVGQTLHVVSAVPQTSGGSVNAVTLTFNEAVLPSSFMLSSVDSLTGPGGSITPSGINEISPTQYQVVFPAQSLQGTYTLTVGPNITDVNGNPMDQNGNGVTGEVPADEYTTTFGLPLPVTLPYSENFSDGIAHGFATQSGGWSVSGGTYNAAPSYTGGDEASLLQVSGPLPSALQFNVTMSATAASGGYYSNGFVVFDYQSPTSFKFAGAFVGLQQWVIGHRDANGWEIDAAASDATIAAGTQFNLQLWLQGANADLYVNGAGKVSFNYGSAFIGSVGLGAENSATQFTNLNVQPVTAGTLPIVENFSDGQAHYFVPQEGSWAVSNSRYDATPVNGGDALTNLTVSGGVPSPLEFSATMNAAAAAGGFYSNGFLIFDYQSPTNFKYAGAFVGLQQWVIGHRDASGWHNDAAVTDSAIAPATDFNLQLWLQGGNADLYVNGVGKVNFNYSSAFTGSVGLGSENSATQFTNLNVQQPAAGTLPIVENFSDGQAHYFVPQEGSWAVSNSHYDATPVNGGDALTSLYVNGSLPSSLEIDVTMNAAAASGGYYSNGFVIFDYQSPTNFKFAGAYVGNQQWVVGHRDATGWHIDAATSDSGIAAGTDYNLQLLLQGDNVSLLVNGVSKVSTAYASAFTGSVGLGTENSLTQFTNLTVKTHS